MTGVLRTTTVPKETEVIERKGVVDLLHNMEYRGAGGGSITSGRGSAIIFKGFIFSF